MDETYRRELRQAELDGDYQRLYSILHRIGRPDEAKNLFLDHPIKVECTVQYRYAVSSYYRETAVREVHGWTLDSLVDNIIAANLAASHINHIIRTPVFQVLDGEIQGNYSKTPLQSIQVDDSILLEIKQRVRKHPDYLRTANSVQRGIAQDADREDEERLALALQMEVDRQARIDEERRRDEAFNADSKTLKEEVWELWEAHGLLPRAQFAKAVLHHPLNCILFHMKTHHDLAVNVGSVQGGVRIHAPHNPVTREILDTIWNRNEEKRYRIYCMERDRTLA